MAQWSLGFWGLDNRTYSLKEQVLGEVVGWGFTFLTLILLTLPNLLWAHRSLSDDVGVWRALIASPAVFLQPLQGLWVIGVLAASLIAVHRVCHRRQQGNRQPVCAYRGVRVGVMARVIGLGLHLLAQAALYAHLPHP